MSTTLLWFRRDLRLGDHPAVQAALQRRAPILPLFILGGDGRPMGGASRWWLDGSLRALDNSLRDLGSRLILRQGDPLAVLGALRRETDASALYWCGVFDPATDNQDRAIKLWGAKTGVECRRFNGSLLFAPGSITNKSSLPFKVFTPFWQTCLDQIPAPVPLAKPDRLPAPDTWPVSEHVDEWCLAPREPDWASGLRASWVPGEASAQARLEAFVASGVSQYKAQRDHPALAGTSKLSPHLRFGEISPRTICHRLKAVVIANGSAHGVDPFLRQLGWREFCYDLLRQNPNMADKPMQSRFEQFPWVEDRQALEAWQKGRTGIPIVDAGMRELWATGWMHNRVRMIVASLLVKNLLLPWQAGEAWFWDCLVDADAANNAAGWQWVAGCGADAAPYFRIFNPVTQSAKYDSMGNYIRRFVPELENLTDTFIHRPWEADASAMRAAGVILGATYPHPIVDLRRSRERALQGFQSLKNIQANS